MKETFIASCCNKEVSIEEAVVNHGMCNEHMDELSDSQPGHKGEVTK
jgi:hypothetical protein